MYKENRVITRQRPQIVQRKFHTRFNNSSCLKFLLRTTRLVLVSDFDLRVVYRTPFQSDERKVQCNQSRKLGLCAI
jgi:hypothetical protein